MVIDPVCKMELSPENAAFTAEYEGQRFHFCSQSCHAKFVADPAKYAGTQSSLRHHPSVPYTRAALGSVVGGAVGAVALLVLYFGLVTLLSGWEFMLEQFQEFWPYVIALAIGFGIQVGLFLYLRRSVHGAHGGKIVAVSGATSGAAMVSCCAHYLVNLLPALGATGFVALIGQYQVQFFWVGLLANAAGIAYIGRRVFLFTKEM